MFLKWFPWRWIIRWASRRYGLIDPASVLARFRKFSEPSEVAEPLEIVRAWFVFHARGIVNTRAIQHNMDWIWPYWVEKQFNPNDRSFIPRAHSISHINMTHRDWSAVGMPGLPLFPLVDPRGLVTPMYDGWSIDFWLIDGQGNQLIPSRAPHGRQQMLLGADHAVQTQTEGAGLKLRSVVRMSDAGDGPNLNIELHPEMENAAGSRLVVAIRPYNPEGIQFVDQIQAVAEGHALQVNKDTRIAFDPPPRRFALSSYEEGDVFHRLDDAPSAQVRCPVGMATGAAVFPMSGGPGDEVRATIPLNEQLRRTTGRAGLPVGPTSARVSWSKVEDRRPKLRVPEPQLQRVYESSARTLALLTPQEVYPGPYTYRRFWYRDACIMLNALLAVNETDACRRLIEEVFPERQRRSGYYESQEGEWDSNGQVLWAAERYRQCVGALPNANAIDSLERAARWLPRKRLGDDLDELHAGLLPAGFSAEHLGPNNYFYWDNFWAIGGLRSAERLFRAAGRGELAEDAGRWADSHEQAVWRSVEQIGDRRSHGGIPAAPNRRMDSGAIGSIVADYPLQLLPPGHERMDRTVAFLLNHCLVRGAFFQDMTHSGMNMYLTLQLAQVMLRAGDTRYFDLVRRVAELASPTGHWAEALHPGTESGCMGDGQHGWAAAEWVLMMRSMFCREEGDQLRVASGLPAEWLASDVELSFGPTATPVGPITVTVDGPADDRRIRVDGDGVKAESICAEPVGYRRLVIDEPGYAYQLRKADS